MSTNISVVKFTFRKDWKALTEALSGKYESEDFSASGDLVSYLSTVPVCLVFSSLSEKDDLIQLASFVKMAKKDAKDTILKIVVVNFSGNKQFEKAIGKLGILDVVDPSINTKALRFKIDFYMKSLNGQVKSSNKAAMNVKSIEQAKAQEQQKKTDAANWLPPLDCEDDIWLLKKDTDCKKVLGRWLVRMTGPGPAVCQWTEVKGKANAWRLEFKGDSKDSFVSGTGTWYYQGDQKPDFVWKENTWLMTGSSFELFYHENGVKLPRLKLKDKVLEICKNSEFALTKETLILESFDKELVFKKEAENLDGKAEVEGEETDWLKNLEGKGSTDHLETDPLEGKNDPAGDQLNTDPMAMDLEPGENNLGAGKMSGKGGAGSDLGGNYEGDSSTDKIDKKGLEGAAGAKPVEGQELGLENKNQEHQTKYKGHNKAEEFEAKDDLLSHSAEKHREGAELGMKNTHNEHKTHYKGHNEAEEFEANGEKKNQYKEKDLGGHNGGKSSTDRIPKFYNKDGTKPNRPLTPEEQAESDAYEGKSSTDKLASHYGRSQSETPESKNNPTEKSNSSVKPAQRKSNEGEFEEDEDTDPYGGKSSTDKLKSHYGTGQKKAEHLSEDDLFDDDESSDSGQSKDAVSKTKQERERKEREKLDPQQKESPSKKLDGTGATDKIETHYGGKKKAASGAEDEDTFEDEEVSGVAAKERRSSSSKTGEKKRADRDEAEDEEDIFERKTTKKTTSSDADDEEDIFERKTNKKNSSSDDDDEEEDLYSRKDSKKRSVREKGDSSFDDDLDDEDDDSSLENKGGDVIPFKSKKTPPPPPLVAEKDIDDDIKGMTAEATITAFVTQNNAEFQCLLDDYFDKTMILITDNPKFNTQDPVKLDLKFKYMQKETSLKFDGKIVSIDGLEGNTSYLTVEISDANAMAFSSFMKLYQQRQDKIEVFLKRAKGL